MRRQPVKSQTPLHEHDVMQYTMDPSLEAAGGPCASCYEVSECLRCVTKEQMQRRRETR